MRPSEKLRRAMALIKNAAKDMGDDDATRVLKQTVNYFSTSMPNLITDIEELGL
jgi:hypothetical protein